MCDCENPDCSLPEFRCCVCEIQPTGDDDPAEVCEYCLPLVRAVEKWEHAACGADGIAWGAFDTGDGWISIQRDDENDRFASDDQAIEWVKALVGEHEQIPDIDADTARIVALRRAGGAS